MPDPSPYAWSIPHRRCLMAKVINCDCGFVVRGGDDAELIENAKAHAREVHGMEMTADQALSLAVPAD